MMIVELPEQICFDRRRLVWISVVIATKRHPSSTNRKPQSVSTGIVGYLRLIYVRERMLNNPDSPPRS